MSLKRQLSEQSVRAAYQLSEESVKAVLYGGISALVWWAWSPLIGKSLLVVVLLCRLFGTHRILRLPVGAYICVMMAFDLVLYIVVRVLIVVVESCSRRRRRERELEAAADYESWQRAAISMDAFERRDVWRQESESPLYDWRQAEATTRRLREAREAGEAEALMALLLPCMKTNVFGVLEGQIYASARAGTKHIIEAFVDEVCASLTWLARQRGLSAQARRRPPPPPPAAPPRPNPPPGPPRAPNPFTLRWRRWRRPPHRLLLPPSPPPAAAPAPCQREAERRAFLAAARASAGSSGPLPWWETPPNLPALSFWRLRPLPRQPRAPPEQLGSLRWPPQPATGRPEVDEFSPCACRHIARQPRAAALGGRHPGSLPLRRGQGAPRDEHAPAGERTHGHRPTTNLHEPSPCQNQAKRPAGTATTYRVLVLCSADAPPRPGR
jgi:hypothetical protein